MLNYNSYDYREAVKNDVLDYIQNEIDLSEWKGNRDGLEEHLNDELWVHDSVTGNASGSYTFNGWKAREYVIDNIDEIRAMIRDFGYDAEDIAEHFINEDWEYWDVGIRCHLLGECIAAALDELDFDAEDEDEDEDEDENE